MIKTIEIKGLFGKKNVKLDIQDDVNIFVGENGMGKTTILNILNNILTLDISALSKMPFESVIIKTVDNKQKTIQKSFINNICYFGIEHNPRFVYMSDRYSVRRSEILKKILTYSNIKAAMELSIKLEKEYKDVNILRIRHSKFFNELNLQYDSPVIELYLFLYENNFLNKLKELYEFIENLHEEIIYFPTYRRIEADLQNLNMSEDQIKTITKNRLINFGMGDVEELLSAKLGKISDSIKQGFNEMALTLLNEYANENSLKVNTVINLEKLNLIFSILSNKINDSLKNKIYGIIERNDGERNNDTLMNFLDKLSDIYQKQDDNIKSIDKFVSICNEYFHNNKKIIFNKEKLRVNIYAKCENESEELGNELKFSDFSSGEKQIVSLFSKLYLGDNENYFILFDEPELSLSLEWQKRLIPDIMQSAKCHKLIAVTHSPFIFDNKYSDKAKALSDAFGK